MSEKIKEWTAKRGQAKGIITRVASFADGMNNNTKTSEVSSRLDLLERAFSEFKEVDSKLTAADCDSEIIEIETKYLNVKVKLKEFATSYGNAGATMIEQFNEIMSRTAEQQHEFLSNFTSTLATSLNQTYLNQSSEEPHFTARLPRLSVPTFDGDYREFQSFKDIFNASVHSKTYLSNAEKFQYLRLSLKGESAELIRHFTTSDANYISAWSKICERYDKRHLAISNFIQTFLDIPVIKENSVKKLRSLHNIADQVIRGLKALGPEAEARDQWLLHILLSKIDPETRQAWALSIVGKGNSTFEEFLKFIDNRCDGLEPCESAKHQQQKQHVAKSHNVITRPNLSDCPYCMKQHRLYECEAFLKLDVNSRRDHVLKANVCFNCLSGTHKVKRCHSRRSCFKCGRRHHTILHEAVAPPAASETTNATNKDAVKGESDQSCSTATVSINIAQSNHAILPTALVQIRDKNGNTHNCNLLLDSGSQISFIAENVADLADLPRRNAKLRIGGLATSEVSTVGRTTIEISPRFGCNWFKMDVYILKNITTTHNYDERCHLHEFDKLELADPNYLESKPIDILMGADYFFQILKKGKLIVAKNIPIAQETLLGWVISGQSDEIRISNANNAKSFNANILENKQLETALKRFWEQEEVQAKPSLSQEEAICENHFKSTVRRNEFGRYIVQLPLKESVGKLGDTFTMAKRRLISMERKMNNNSEFGQMYRAFMKEYLELKHMVKISPEKMFAKQHEVCYLPHHGVIKASSDTTKLRVVFDGSCVSSSGISLNNKLQIGPTVQPTLVDILLRFRTFPIAITADIEKMYRQILLDHTQTQYQRILWRFSTDHPIEQYELSTVTYGLASASFLATRVLMELAENYEQEYPNVASIIRNNFYVDDLLTGAKNEEQALKIKNEIDHVLKLGGFVLRKWKSNSALLSDANESNVIVLNSDNSEISQVLGLYWKSKHDVFAFKVQIPAETKCTNRSILSIASRLFDPLGWLTPFTVNIKILMQKLWFHKLSWDDELPSEVQQRWHEIKTQFESIKEINVPRFVCPVTSPLEIHGFSDASEDAFAAAVYIRTTIDGQVKINLLSSKSKVAPIQQISIPRLELCGAHLLAKLVSSICKSYELTNASVNLWTDSTIVLSWLTGPPRKWKTYVGNRTSQIFQYVPDAIWRHVRSQDNPADLPSRGITTTTLINSNLWWAGPEWLRKSKEFWPQSIEIPNTQEEMRQKTISLATTISEHFAHRLIENASEWKRAIATMVQMKRFIYNIKHKNSKIKGWLMTDELLQAELLIIKGIQGSEFALDISQLQRHKIVKPNSRLISLAPFIDKSGLLRVGGRLKNANCPYEQKHPIILPKHHKISTLILNHLHIKYLHPGPTHLTAISRLHYWILGVRETARRICRRCVKCFRYAANKSSQLMGNLPSQRVIPARPFNSTGIDYAGPIMLATKRGRGAKLVKGYVAIFICLVTKAIHIEVASDLTTESFLAVLKRFTARRGVPTQIFSDNGTNFIGAKKILSDIYRFLDSESCKNEVMKYAASNRIRWSFIPPAAPNFGGLWERAVRSVKSHLIKVIGNSHLTFEDMTTVLVQIENVLNSRPLCAITNEDTDNIGALTPAHFLMLGPAAMIPENDYTNLSISRLTRWQHVQQMVQSFWKRFSRDYLNNLQQRSKWKKETRNLQVNDVVLLKDHSAPCNWPLARIIEVHPGNDGCIRVVTVKNQTIYSKASNNEDLPITNQ